MDINALIDQADHVRSRTLKLFDGVDAELWTVVPEGSNSCLAWQAGHIIISEYFNAVACPFGPDRSYYDLFPIKEYATKYGIGSKGTEVAGHDDKTTFMERFETVHAKSMDIWRGLEPAQLDGSPVLKHPTYQTIPDIIRWSSLHEMWHLGQVAALRTLLGVGLQFSSS